MYASKNQKVTLPDVPKVKGYTNLGWTTEKGETEPDVYKRQGKRSDQGKVEKMLAALNIHPTLDRLLNEKEQEGSVR